MTEQRLIDANALIEKCGDWYTEEGTEEGYIGTINGIVNSMPTIEPERKTGHWERHNTYYGDDVSGSIDPDWRCSECGGQANVNAWCLYDLTDFCPNCGARMEGEEHG